MAITSELWTTPRPRIQTLVLYDSANVYCIRDDGRSFFNVPWQAMCFFATKYVLSQLLHTRRIPPDARLSNLPTVLRFSHLSPRWQHRFEAYTSTELPIRSRCAFVPFGTRVRRHRWRL